MKQFKWRRNMTAFDFYHSPASSEGGACPPQAAAFSKPWYMSLFFYFNEDKILGTVVECFKSMLSEKPWPACEEEKKTLYYYCIVCATVSNSWISCSRVIGLYYINTLET